MLKAISILAVAAVAAAIPASATASPEFSSSAQLTYSTQAPNSSSGLTTLATWADPGEPFGKPVVLTKIVFAFEPGTRFDTAALPVCKATDQDVRALGVKACPRKSLLGTGDTNAIAAANLPITTVVSLFNAKKQIIVVIELNGKKLTFFRDDVGPGVINVNLKIPAGIALTRLHIVFPPHSLKVRRKGKKPKKHVYMTTPKSCPATKVWTTNATFSYADGSSQSLASTTPCS